MKKNIKNIIIFVIILIIVAVGYYLFFGKTSSLTGVAPSSSLQTSTGQVPIDSVIDPNSMTTIDASQISQEFVNQLLNLQAIKLNDDIFSSLAFQSLQDFSIVLVQPGNEGRPNPFAPFGSDDENPDATTTPVDSGIVVTPVDSNSSSTDNTLPNANNL
jgi:hypothetical protein